MMIDLVKKKLGIKDAPETKPAAAPKKIIIDKFIKAIR
jgi:hypothetical protein